MCGVERPLVSEFAPSPSSVQSQRRFVVQVSGHAQKLPVVLGDIFSCKILIK